MRTLLRLPPRHAAQMVYERPYAVRDARKARRARQAMMSHTDAAA